MAQAPYEPGEPVVDWTDPLSPVIYVADRDGVLRPSVVGPHGHEIADVTGLSAALLGKTDVGHGHAVADVTGLLVLGVSAQKPKSMAVQAWVTSIWTLYYSRKPLVTHEYQPELLDFSGCGVIPFTVPDLLAEVMP